MFIERALGGSPIAQHFLFEVAEWANRRADDKEWQHISFKVAHQFLRSAAERGHPIAMYEVVRRFIVTGGKACEFIELTAGTPKLVTGLKAAAMGNYAKLIRLAVHGQKALSEEGKNSLH